MKDLRRRARVPFGYRIEDGAAVIDPEEASALKLYFKRYLDGQSMSRAAREAQIPCSSTALPHFFKRKEYLGTDFYPALITEDYQRQLLAEYESRRRKQVRMAPGYSEKGVRLYKEFRLARIRSYDSGDPVDCAAALYQRIRPKTK